MSSLAPVHLAQADKPLPAPRHWRAPCWGIVRAKNGVGRRSPSAARMVGRCNEKETDMGLEMYAHSLPADENIPPVDFDIKIIDDRPNDCPEIHYWCKHPNLHGWMEGLYIAKGGTDRSFNVATLQLTPDDIDELEQAIRDQTLPFTTGFFFGGSDGSELEDDLAFIAKAREEFAKGNTVAYYAWW